MSKSRPLPWVLLPGHLRGARSCRGPVNPRGCWGSWWKSCWAMGPQRLLGFVRLVETCFEVGRRCSERESRGVLSRR